jgi:transcriptional regulator with XRE-family HTH domain
MPDRAVLEQLGTAERIRFLRLKKQLSEQELAGELGLTLEGYRSLEKEDGELESAVSIAQALKLSALLGAGVLELLGEFEQPAAIPIDRVRSALSAQLRNSSEAQQGLEDAIDWDLEPFLQGTPEWTSVYTIEFLKKLSVPTEIDWQVLLGGIGAP